MKKIKNKEKLTCFKFCADNNVNCQQSECRQWINFSNSKNCSIIAASQGRRTLQEIGDIFGLTRMRVCQIEKSALKKIQKTIRKSLE